MILPEIEKFHLHKDEPNKLQFEIMSLREMMISTHPHNTIPHVHSFYQIIWFQKGSGVHYVDFNAYPVQPNTLYLISKGQIHNFDDNIYEGYIIHFNESFISNSDNFVNLFLNQNLFHSFEKEPYFRFESNNTQHLLPIFQAMLNEMNSPNHFAHQEYLSLQLHILLILIQRLGLRNNCLNLSLNNPSHRLYIQFRNYIEEYFYQDHTVTQYAQRLHVSNKTLTNCTNVISQQTPLQIINERIILEAKRLLHYSDKSINEIAFQLGFDDTSYFIKFFKKYMQVLPTQYRKSIS